MIFKFPLKTSGFRIYQEVWAVAHSILKQDSEAVLKDNLWWESDNWDDIVKINHENGVFTPFVIKTIMMGKQTCCACNFVKKCNGCILLPSTDILENFFPQSNFVIEWNSELIES